MTCPTRRPQSLLRGIESWQTGDDDPTAAWPQSLLRGIERRASGTRSRPTRRPQSLLRGIESPSRSASPRPALPASIAPQRHRKTLAEVLAALPWEGPQSLLRGIESRGHAASRVAAPGLNRSSEASKGARPRPSARSRQRPQSLLRGIERRRDFRLHVAHEPQSLLRGIERSRCDASTRRSTRGLNRSSEASKAAPRGLDRPLARQPQSLLRGIERRGR